MDGTISRDRYECVLREEVCVEGMEKKGGKGVDIDGATAAAGSTCS